MTGHQTLNDLIEIKDILNVINNHEHFHIHFFAADGETSLNALHKKGFDNYSKLISKVIRAEMKINEFVRKAYFLCSIIPILDMLHSVKSGRNKIITNIIKLGDGCDLICSDELDNDLNLNDKVLNDKTTIGKMKDHYALRLFTITNAFIEFGKEKNSTGFYIMIYSLIIEIFRNSFFCLDLRILITDFCLYLLLFLIQSSQKLPSETSYKKSKNFKYVWFNSKIGIIMILMELL